MANPIDWGNQPIWVGLARGVIAAFLIGLINTLVVRNGGGVSWETAISAGAISGIPILLVLIGYGGYDQYRAANNITIAGDVPEAAPNVKVTVK